MMHAFVVLLSLATMNVEPIVLAAPTVHAFIATYGAEQPAPIPSDIELLSVFPRGSWLVENRATGKWRVVKPVACPSGVTVESGTDCFFIADPAWNQQGFCSRRIGK